MGTLQNSAREFRRISLGVDREARDGDSAKLRAGIPQNFVAESVVRPGVGLNFT